MKVFISWSGDISYQVAKALHEWLPDILHRLSGHWMSTDIAAGTRWSAVLSNELSAANLEIFALLRVCESPWGRASLSQPSLLPNATVLFSAFSGDSGAVAYKGIIENYQVVVSTEPSEREWKLYIDGDLRDTYHGDLYSSGWRTILRGSIVRKDGHSSAIEVQIKSRFFSRFMRVLFAGKEIVKAFKY